MIKRYKPRFDRLFYGIVIFTATVVLGAEYAGKTAQIKLCMNGNKGVQNLEIPFALK